ncbi:hypothetical protein FACS1894139_08290 [Planctomycetales bacterium]|nr:hypothetical protein FACS1894108_01430 [Planctomycetales bacterium]GHT05084.1 hypothetical protein FACS1894139_08290 [Planctomycetales bacterium]
MSSIVGEIGKTMRQPRPAPNPGAAVLDDDALLTATRLGASFFADCGDAAPDDAPEDLPNDAPLADKIASAPRPRRFGNAAADDYQSGEILGEGGMGRVEEARQTALDRVVAVKWLTQCGGEARFRREAKITGVLEHPNIVPVYDLGVDGKGNLYYAMRRVYGTPWVKAFDDHSLPENIDILLAVCDAVAYAHEKWGVIHRDLKPENVMLGDYHEVLVVDWGLAAGMTKNSPAPRVTYADAIAGTPAYMAPEMANGYEHKIGFHSDIYLLGAILFEIVTGEQPHTGGSVTECLQAAAENKIVEAWVDSPLLKTARRAMATAPEERFASVKELQAAIRRHSESIIISTRARQHLTRAGKSGDYCAYFRAIGGLLAALEIWDDNDDAKKALALATQQFAALARQNGDENLAGRLEERVEG